MGDQKLKVTDNRIFTEDGELREEFDRQAKLHIDKTKLVAVRPRALWLSTLLAAGGVTLVILGANWMVSNTSSFRFRLNCIKYLVTKDMSNLAF